jgi:hypothetical protein
MVFDASASPARQPSANSVTNSAKNNFAAVDFM